MWPQLSGPGAARVARSLGVPGVPVEFVFDHEGVVVGKSGGWGSRTYRDLAVYVEGAVKKAKKALDAESSRRSP